MSPPRIATHDGIPTATAPIELTGRALGAGFHTPAQAGAITRHVFGVDTRPVDDGTYDVVEGGGQRVVCGGWGRRRMLVGGDRCKAGPDPLLEPATGPARIRAFFVHPEVARRGPGHGLLGTCAEAARQAGFTRLERVATPTGGPLYAAAGFAAVERFTLHLPPGIEVPVVPMQRAA